MRRTCSALWVTQAALPWLREQGSGHILRVSSIGGISAFVSTGAYHASKWALEGLSQSLAQEVAGFGIKLALIEPSGYATDWAGSSARHATPLAVYDALREQAVQARARRFPGPGDPAATRDAVLLLVDTPNSPLRMFLGEAPLGIATADYESRVPIWREWQPVAAAAQNRGKLGSRHKRQPLSCRPTTRGRAGVLRPGARRRIPAAVRSAACERIHGARRPGAGGGPVAGDARRSAAGARSCLVPSGTSRLGRLREGPRGRR